MSNVYLKRVKRLQKGLKYAALWIENPVDIYYLTGVTLSTGAVVVTSRIASLHVDGRYTQAAKQASALPVEALEKSALIKGLPKQGAVGFDAGHLTYGRYKTLEKDFGKRFAPLSAPIDPLRVIKDDEELVWMRKSAKLLWKGFKHALSCLKPGMTEREVMLIFEQYVKAHGARRLSFDPIIAFGKNTAMPHYQTGKTKLKKSDIVLFDAGVELGGYHSDMTRTFFYGKPAQNLVSILQTTIEAQKAACKLCKPGVKLKELDLAAREVMARSGMEQYFVHSLGHGIGLDVHEWPRVSSSGPDKDVTLMPGMAITVEPGLYIPGLGGARWEDTLVITKAGHENLYGKRLDICYRLG